MESDNGEEDHKMEELSVSFGYQFRMCADGELNSKHQSTEESVSYRLPPTAAKLRARRGASFSCLSGAALGANATLANTRLGKGLIGQEILPGLDSPKSFRPLEKSPSFSKIESLMSSTMAASCLPEGSHASASAPQIMESQSFLSAADAQTAGGAAGEDRVQAVCSEEDGWLFCAIYDGFNGRDAADFLAVTLYENISFNLMQLQWQTQHPQGQRSHSQEMEVESCSEEGGCSRERQDQGADEPSFEEGVLKALRKALEEAEEGFMEMVRQEMDERPDLVMVGSCVLVVLLHGQHLYTLSLGDSRAVLATTNQSTQNEGEQQQGGSSKPLHWVQLTEDHVVAERAERERVIAEHPDDPCTIVSSRVKGKIKLTRAFGAGYLKKANLNDKLMGLLRVHNLSSPPYISAKPHLNGHRVCEGDEFVVMGSDGLFDFFTNEEVVELVHRFILHNPNADPAKYMLDQLLIRAADHAGMTLERLKNIQIGRRRAYHDDVTIMVVTLGAEHRTSSASTIS